MTHYLFTLWDGAGALPAELSVARALVERGHRVSVLSEADTTRAIEELRPDALVSSGMLLGPQIAGDVAGLPVTALIPNIYFLPVPGRPPFGTGRQPARGPLGRARDRAVTALGGRAWRAGLEPLNATRRRYGLAPLAHVWEQLDHARRVLVLSSRCFDDPSPLPANVRYVGARLGDPGWVEAWRPPAGDAPRVYLGPRSRPRGSC